jgi:surface antigen
VRFVMRKTVKMAGLMALLSVAPLAPAHAGNQEIFGTGIGAALGGLLGSQISRGSAQLPVTAAGVFFGGLMGNSIGSSMDRTDRLYSNHHRYPATIPPTYYEVTRTAYRPNYVAAPDIPPTMYYSAASAYTPPTPYCREYSQRVWIGGAVRESYGTACLQPDGSWRVVQ